jgi:hypothetical protein
MVTQPLAKCLDAGCFGRSGAKYEETDPRDLLCLLRLGHNPTKDEC